MVIVTSDLWQRYEKFLSALEDPSKPPLKLYKPRTPKQLEELLLTREISVSLQQKKDDEISGPPENNDTKDEDKKEEDVGKENDEDKVPVTN